MTGSSATERRERIGATFVDAVVGRDLRGLRALMADDLRFRLLVPRGPQAHTGVEEAVGRFAGWYGDADEIELEASNVHSVGDRVSIMYRLRVHNPDGWRVLEQHLLADVAADGYLDAIDLLCSGFHPVHTQCPVGVHRLDAGDMGCAGGLAAQFRQRIGEIPIGEVLWVTVRDPAARADLPPLVRMMGHAVRTVETSEDRRLVIAVERRR